MADFLDPDEGLKKAKQDIGLASPQVDLARPQPELGEKPNDIETVVTIQDLLRSLETDKYEKLYIALAAEENSKAGKRPIEQDTLTNDETLERICNLAEIKLSKLQESDRSDTKFTEKEVDDLKLAANYYVIPHKASKMVYNGKERVEQEVEISVIHDMEGNGLYNIIDDNTVSMTSSFRKRITDYLEQNYAKEIENGQINTQEILDEFSVSNIEEVYTLVQGGDISFRYLSYRIDMSLKAKGIETRTNTGKDVSTIEKDQTLDEYNQIDDKEEKEEPKPEKIEPQGEGIAVEENKKEKPKVESYIEKIARFNHVNPAVVNTRVIEDLDRIKEDSGIDLKSKGYHPGEVVAVRIPYKFNYRTFLAEIETGITIDEKGFLENRENRLVNVREFQDYFRYDIRDGMDGGERGIPLRENEKKSGMTQINEIGDVTVVDFKNNEEKEDMLKDERERYLAEVQEIDNELSDAIKEYERTATPENWSRVNEAMKARIRIDNKYNALDNQREVTNQTKENTQDILDRSSPTERSPRIADEDDDEWFPGHRPPHF